MRANRYASGGSGCQEGCHLGRARPESDLAVPPLFLYMYVCAPGSERKSRGECLCLVCIAKGSTHDHVMLELACAAERGLVRCELCAYFYTGYSVPTTVSRILYIAYGYAVSAISAARRSRMHRNCKAGQTKVKTCPNGPNANPPSNPREKSV